jgi:CRP/FNR family transcriptional regulator, cyclic AMP receptor protein
VFGWSAAMMRDIYSSGAQAAEESDVLRISGCQLRKLCEKNPDTGSLLLNRLAGVIAERLQHTHTQIVNILSRGHGPRK